MLLFFILSVFYLIINNFYVINKLFLNFSKIFFDRHYKNMSIMPITQHNTNQPTFQACALKKAKYAVEYVDCAFQKNYPPPDIYRQFLPFQPEKAPFKTLILKSDKPMEDLKDIYELYKQDFSCYHHYLSFKKFKNNMHYENATVFTLKSGKETYGFYSIAETKDKTLYVCDVDLAPKYRNTKFGRDIILTCWDNINQIAKENECPKIGLHVDANKKNLINLNKKLGFNIVENKTSKHTTGQTAFYMEKGVKG